MSMNWKSETRKKPGKLGNTKLDKKIDEANTEKLRRYLANLTATYNAY